MLKFFLISFFLYINIYFSIAHADYSSYIYSEDSVNIVSSKQVNAIEFPVPILQVNSPSGQLEKNNKSVSYVNKNKTMLFYLPSEEKDIQFMVTLINGRVLSLNFKGDQSKGKIIRIPESLSGDIKIKNSNKSLDMKIKSIMQSAFMDNFYEEKWTKTKESYDGNYKNICIKKYTEWENNLYKTRRWDICSHSKNNVFIYYKNIFYKNKVLAVTLNKNKLSKNQCAKLIILFLKYNKNAV